MHSVMNNTKWRELQMSMYSLESNRPLWRTLCTTNGYLSSWDGEWYYHFSEGGFDDIEWVELKIENELQRKLVLDQLRSIHLPGEVTDEGYKIYGYINIGKPIDYL
jgi:Family of unknown function (DUF6678)